MTAATAGDVWLVADRNVASLLAFRDHPHRRAENGTHGQGKKRHGAGGDDLVVPVPEGTVVATLEGEVLADLVSAGDRWRAAAGGQGGRGNARFLSNRRRAPGFAEQGEVGEERWFRLELKLMADVALVGFPNVGKSTLISRISAAKPKIADYPFTTLEPNLGVVRLDDGDIVVADIPGLIEGASEGKGLGHRFLRHVERARVLAVLLDLAPTAPAPPAEQEEVLLRELGAYRPELLERPRLVRREPCRPRRRGRGSWTGPGALGRHRRGCARRGRAGWPTWSGGPGPPRGSPPAFVVHRPVPEGIRIEREDDGSFRVVGRQAERAVALSDITNPDALAYAQHRLDKLGVPKALVRAGARSGDLVRIGGFAFDFEPDDQPA